LLTSPWFSGSQIEKSFDLDNVLVVLEDMAMGTCKKRDRQQDLWMATGAVVEPPGNAFYDRLNEILDEHHFDRKSRLSAGSSTRRVLMAARTLLLGSIFRALLIGYFEGLASERAIA
jgi:transposase